MRILLVNRYFGSEQVPTGRMVGDLAAELLRQGHAVRAFTSGDSYVHSDPHAPVHGEVAITRLWTGGSKRLVSWVLFWLQVCLRLPFACWDRCVVLTDPPFMVFSALPARIVGGRRRRFYWWTMDLYPEALVAHGMIRNNRLAHRLLKWLTNLSVRATTGIVCLGPRQRERLACYRGFRDAPDFCAVVPPWDNRPIPRVERRDNRFLAKYGWQDKRIVLYAGNLGEAHCFAEAVAAARLLWERGERDWMFVFAVRGASKADLQAQATGLPNVAVLDYEPPELTADVLWSAHVHLITMSEGWDGIVVPSKLYGVLHTDAPVLFIGPAQADTAQEIRAKGVGETLPAGCAAEDVVAALQKLIATPGRPRTPGTDGPAAVAAFITGGG